MARHGIIAIVAASFVLAACGPDRPTRALTGAAGGAVAGELIAERPVEGAVAGGLLGLVR